MAFLKMLPMLAAAAMFYFAMPMQDTAQPKAQTPINTIPGTQPIPPNVVLKDRNDMDSTPAATGTPAGESTGTRDRDGNRKMCKDLPSAKGGVLIGRIVPCIVYTIQESTIYFSKKMINFISPLMYAYITLVIVLYGVRIVSGDQQAPRQAMLLGVKISIIIGMLTLIPNYFIPATYDIMAQGVEVASSSHGTNGGIGCSSAAIYNTYGDAQTLTIWKEMDCTLGKLYGFATGTDAQGNKTTNMLLASSAFGLLSGFFFGGTIGVALFFALIGVLFSILMLVIRVTLVFLNGYLIVSVLLLIAPIFMPLTLMKVTSDYFEKWWKAILGGFILPVVVTAYSTIALVAYDDILFKPNSLMQNLFNSHAIKSATEQKHALCNNTIKGDTKSQLDSFYNKNMGAIEGTERPELDPVTGQSNIRKTMDKLVKSPFIANFANPLLTSASDPCGMLSVPTFDITKVNMGVTGVKDPTFENKKVVMTELFMQAVKLFIMSYLISSGLRSVEDTFSSLSAGSGLGTVALRQGAITGAMQNGFDSLKQKLSDRVRYKFDDKGEEQFGPDGERIDSETPYNATTKRYEPKKWDEASGKALLKKLPGEADKAWDEVRVDALKDKIPRTAPKTTASTTGGTLSGIRKGDE